MRFPAKGSRKLTRLRREVARLKMERDILRNRGLLREGVDVKFGFPLGNTMRGKPPITIPDDARKQAIASIQRYFADELDQSIGDLKAALVLDFVLAELGPVVYNQAIADAKRFFDERAADLAALCHREEFPYWTAPTKRTR